MQLVSHFLPLTDHSTNLDRSTISGPVSTRIQASSLIILADVSLNSKGKVGKTEAQKALANLASELNLSTPRMQLIYGR